MEKTFDETWFHAPLNAVGETGFLPESESSHLQRVFRIRPGRRIVVTNGAGLVFECDTRMKDGELEVEATAILVENPEPPRLHLVLSMLKGRELEEPVEGLTQLPIASIHLVTTDLSQEFKDQDFTRLLERLRLKSMVALKQAKKPWLTAIEEPVSLRTWRRKNPGVIILTHPGMDRLENLGTGSLFLLIGPEGGFSPGELEWLTGPEECRVLGLGTTRIRGTHAPLLACGKLMGLGHF